MDSYEDFSHGKLAHFVALTLTRYRLNLVAIPSFSLLLLLLLLTVCLKALSVFLKKTIYDNLIPFLYFVVMKTQNYHNYKRYYTPHHFIFLPMMGTLIGVGILKAAYADRTHWLEWTLFSILSFSILYLALMVRQHYALGNQDRIVRLEFRLRYFELLGERSAQAEQKLSFAQIAALRFADDREFIILLSRALTNNLSSEEIKKSITNWQADDMRL